jgi:hypothetical protein
MKTLAFAAFLALTPGCSVMTALGLGTTDVLPSLKYCDNIQYVRSGTTMEIHAQCKVPAG